MAKEPGLINVVYTKSTSVTKEFLGTADDGMKLVRKGLNTLDPMAGEMLNDAKTDLTDSIVRLGEARKAAEAKLIAAGFSDSEVAEMLAPTK